MFGCDKISQSKGLIWILNCNIPDIGHYGSALMKKYKL